MITKVVLTENVTINGVAYSKGATLVINENNNEFDLIDELGAEFTRKPISWDDIEKTRVDSLRHADRLFSLFIYSNEALYGDNNIYEGFAIDVSATPTFIVYHTQRKKYYLIHTAGYNYAKYMIELEGFVVDRLSIEAVETITTLTAEGWSSSAIAGKLMLEGLPYVSTETVNKVKEGFDAKID